MRSFPEKEFKRRMRVSKFTFKYLCTLLGPMLKKKKKHILEKVLVLNVELRYFISISNWEFIKNDWRCIRHRIEYNFNNCEGML